MGKHYKKSGNKNNLSLASKVDLITAILNLVAALLVYLEKLAR